MNITKLVIPFRGKYRKAKLNSSVQAQVDLCFQWSYESIIFNNHRGFIVM